MYNIKPHSEIVGTGPVRYLRVVDENITVTVENGVQTTIVQPEYASIPIKVVKVEDERTGADTIRINQVVEKEMAKMPVKTGTDAK